MTGQPDRVDLEMKIAFLERTVDTLNEVVVEQGASLERLEQKLAQVESRLRSQGEGEEEARDLADDKPPHY